MRRCANVANYMWLDNDNMSHSNRMDIGHQKDDIREFGVYTIVLI
jgi:hypothetical protein